MTDSALHVTWIYLRFSITPLRGSENHAVLVGESYLNELEAAAKRLRDIESGNAKPASDFKLIGSGRLADGVDDPLADMRRDANALSEKKLASFSR